MPTRVQRTAEFRRIAALPRRKVSEEEAEELAEHLAPELVCRGYEGRPRQWQALALAELAENGGAFLGYPVGTGKTMIAEWAPLVTGARRAVLVIPATMRDKTYGDRAAALGKWRLASPPPRIISFEELALEVNRGLLEQIQPDLIIIDEADQLANFEAAAPQRLHRYILDHGPAVLIMTGTPGRQSVMNYWHLLVWALKDGAPVPFDQSEAATWAAALDHKNGRAWRGNIDPGPLGANVSEARQWFARRLRETPGVILLDGDSCDQPLTIDIRIAKESKAINEAFRDLLKTGENVRGIPCADPLSRLRAECQTGCGYVQFWDPMPPEDWVLARRAFANFSRAAIDRSRRTSQPLDTELQVRRRFAEHPVVEEWEELRPTFTPVTHAEWICDSAIESAEEWLEESDEPGVVWCGSVEFAERLAERTGLGYYAAKGQDARTGIGLHAAPRGKSLIASWNANKRGFNLQPWRRALIVYPPQSAKFLEQVYGRHHRANQTKPVRITMLATSGAVLDGFDAALAEAGFLRETVSMTQKILRADIRAAEPKQTRSNRYRWARKER